MKLKYIYFSILTAAAGILFIAAFSTVKVADAEVKRNEKIIKFSHSFHADLAECSVCHSKAAESTSMKDRLMPGHEECSSCHDTDNSEQCNTCHYDDKYEPLVQNKSAIGAELNFNHKFHVVDKKMACETCHAGIKDVDYAAKAKKPYPLMADCYTCHNDKSGATNACESCHKSTVNLLPQSHRDVSFIKTHKFKANDVSADCVMCHNNNNNSCENCHAASGVKAANTPDDFIQPHAPNNFSDGAKKQKLTRVHELNYRFSHGIDVKTKRLDCASCHNTEDFCQTCHQANGKDYAMNGIMPASHLKNDFFTIGRGTGGGEHARLAKRDIESCIACHDVQGADPTCITCHLDSDGIKGTNPKTHPANFMKNTHGDWHDSDGSMCFNCHTSTHTAGVGFCGYCHGSNKD
jgi:hypothetical protein